MRSKGGSSSELGSNHHSILKYVQVLAGGKQQVLKERFLSTLRGQSMQKEVMLIVEIRVI